MASASDPNFDIKRARRDLYAPRQHRFEVINVPPMRFVMADGEGDPNTSAAYRAVVEALYSCSYAIRKAAMTELGRKHTVGPLEGLWSSDDMTTFRTRDKNAWQWTMMIVQPEWITSEMFATAVRATALKGLPAAELLRFEMYAEGLSVQTLHVGPYDDEGPTIARMHDRILPAESLTKTGRHHEVYLSDVRKTEPNRLRTILRQPVSRR